MGSGGRASPGVQPRSRRRFLCCSGQAEAAWKQRAQGVPRRGHCTGTNTPQTGCTGSPTLCPVLPQCQAHSSETRIWDFGALTQTVLQNPPRAALLAGSEQGESSGAALLPMGLIFGANRTSLLPTASLGSRESSRAQHSPPQSHAAFGTRGLERRAMRRISWMGARGGHSSSPSGGLWGDPPTSQ